MSVTEETTGESAAEKRPTTEEQPRAGEPPGSGDQAGAGEPSGAEEPSAGSASRPGPRPWRWTRWAVVAAALLAVAGAGLQVLAARAGHAPPNRALVDREATSVVTGDVSDGLSRIFSYAPDSTAATEQAAAEVLDGPAASQYRTLFAQVKQHAAQERLTVTTRVVRAGVIRLSGRTAQVLVFLDQVIVRKDKPKGTSAAAQLAISARLEGGHWRIVDIHAR